MKPLLLFGLDVEDYWLVPVVGVAACGLAYLLGRRFFAGRPAAPATPDDGLDPSFLQGVTQERRATPRRRGNLVEVQLVDGDGTSLRGWVVDRSQGGLGLLVEQPLAAGVALRVRPSAVGSSAPWTEVTVRSCRPEGSQYELGCQFIHMPNYGQLLQFG